MVHDGHRGPKEIGVQPEFLAWLTDPAQNGAGALFDFGCYGANLMTWLMDDARPTTVTAVTQRIKPDVYPKVDDEATIILEYPGAQAIIQASWNWPFDRKDMEIYGRTGQVLTVAQDGLRVRLAGKPEETRQAPRSRRPRTTSSATSPPSSAARSSPRASPRSEQPDRRRDPRRRPPLRRHRADGPAGLSGAGRSVMRRGMAVRGMMASVLARERIIARPGFDRWLIPPAALAIHLCIGQAYAFSVFNLPLTRAIGITRSAPGDWRLTDVGWTFTLAMVCLGLSAACGGKWLERVGPRTSGVVAACLWGLGFVVAAWGVRTHNIGLLHLGYGVLGGCGLGLGYITPVSTLIKWFPDRRGMATGMAIMGFGGGAMVAAPLSEALMRHFATAGSVGVAETFLVLGAVYFVAMLAGAFLFRLPAPGWRPRGWVEPATTRALASDRHVPVDVATLTPQFGLLWAVLFLNVTAGIGVLGQASAMIQEVFKGRIDAAAAAGFVGLLSLFNMAGRFGWASASDLIGRKATYSIFFLLGAVLYASVPVAGRTGNVPLFVGCLAVALSMYGGGFATVPAYLADLFGTRQVGAIHGRLLTAWSAAGVAGPVLINYARQYQVDHGVARAAAYNVTMNIVAGLLLVGLIANLLIARVASRHTRPAPTARRWTPPPLHPGGISPQRSRADGSPNRR